MRLDVFLSLSRLIKRRSLAKKACDFGAVLIDGVPAKPSHNVRISQKIQIDFFNRVLEVKVIAIPVEKNIRKEDTRDFFEVIKEERRRVLDE